MFRTQLAIQCFLRPKAKNRVSCIYHQNHVILNPKFIIIEIHISTIKKKKKKKIFFLNQNLSKSRLKKKKKVLMPLTTHFDP